MFSMSMRALHLVSPAALAASPRRFTLAALAGRFVELSGRGASSVLSVAVQLVLEAQRQGKNTVWVSLSPTRRAVPFHAPDVAAAGVDLRALPVVIAPGPLEAGRAASHLLRSGAFALVVLDLVPAVEPALELPLPLQARLTGLAQTHGSVLLALTDKPPEAGSLGSLVSLHAHVSRARTGEAAWANDTASDGYARFAVEVVARKDKRNGPGWTHREVFRAPAGLST